MVSIKYVIDSFQILFSAIPIRVFNFYNCAYAKTVAV